MEIKSSHIRQATTTHSEAAKTQVGSLVLWWKVKSRHRNGKGIWKNKVKVRIHLERGCCARGASWPWNKRIVWDWCRICAWISLVDSKVKVGTEIREEVSYESNPGHLISNCFKSYGLPSSGFTVNINLASQKLYLQHCVFQCYLLQ